MIPVCGTKSKVFDIVERNAKHMLKHTVDRTCRRRCAETIPHLSQCEQVNVMLAVARIPKQTIKATTCIIVGVVLAQHIFAWTP